MTTLRAVACLGLSLLAGWLWPTGGALGASAPDLPLVAVMMVASARPHEEAILLAALAGLLESAVSTAPFASQAIVLAVIAYLGGRFAGRVTLGFLPVRFALLVLASVTAAGLTRLVAHLLGEVTLASVSGNVLARAVVTGLAGAVVWRSPRAAKVGATT